MWAAIALAACATPLEPAQVADLPPVVLLPSVPFYEQRNDDCGAASLAMVLHWSGTRVEPEDLAAEVYTAARAGALPTDVTGASRRYGRVPYPVGDLESLLRELGAGRPVLVLQNLGLSWTPVWHYAVAVGYDLERSRLVLHTGTERAREVSLRSFARTWQRADRWALLVVPPETFPVAASAHDALAAGAALEQAGRREESERLYEAAASVWPDSAQARMGLGNVRYARRDLPGAAAAFRAAIALQPDSAPAHNNLAHVLLEAGDLEGARAAADRAIALGGPLSATYRETGRAIDRKLRSRAGDVEPTEP